MAVTLKDLAASLGLSVTTVSRALADYDDVADKTRRRVRQMAQEMGYYPSATARQLRKQRTDTLAFVIPTDGSRFSDPFFSELLAGIGNEAGRHRFDLLVSTQSPNSDAEREAYRRIVNGRRADGVLVARTRQEDERIRFLTEQGFPFVAFGRSELDAQFPYVDEDSYAGIRLLTQHLVSLGHQRIGFISGPAGLLFSRLRLDGYCSVLKECELPANGAFIVSGDLTKPSGFQATQELLALSPRPTAIVACNDLMALGAMSAAQELGLTIGDDLSVGGFDDIPLAEHAHPPLTTVRQPIYEIGQRIARLLIQLIQGQPMAGEGGDTPAEAQVVLTPQLVIRNSTGPPPADVQGAGPSSVQKGGVAAHVDSAAVVFPTTSETD
jgi:LacI family transcriptional regulator